LIGVATVLIKWSLKMHNIWIIIGIDIDDDVNNIGNHLWTTIE